MASNRNDDDSARTAAGVGDGNRVQSADGRGHDSWHEYCRRFSELKNDWLNFMSKNRLDRRQSSLTKCFRFAPGFISAAEANDISLLNDLKPLDRCVTVHDYEYSLRTLAKFHAVIRAIETRAYDKFNVKLTFTYDVNGSLDWYGITAPELCGRLPSDYVILQNLTRTWMEAVRIEEICYNQVILDKKRSLFYAKNFKDKSINVFFFESSNTFGYLHAAIDEFRENIRMQMIAVEEINLLARHSPARIAPNSTNTIELRTRLDNLDAGQRKAVVDILRARCWPRAYIIHGPPGSGKSHTIVEAVIQIFKRPDLSMLVCAGPNSCADDLYEKIGPHLPSPCILRLRKGIEAKNAYFKQRIVVTTNFKSSHLINFARFDYVFIDQANFTTAAELLVPISLLKEDGHLVLAGNLCSSVLIPDSRSSGLVTMGYYKSLLDRIIEFRVYTENRENSDYMTELAHCHRVDDRIMVTLNRLFYDEQVKCSKQTPRSLLNILQLTGPVQFLKVFGREDEPDPRGSIANENEANACVDIIIRLYKIGLEPGQVGVMSPFLRQTEVVKSKLAAALETDESLLNQRFPMQSRDGLDNWLCRIGRIESFQGIEREVIIISTVASPDSVDSADFSSFVSSRGHFNLAISRAKWLLIVVGNLDALNRGKYLPELMANGHTGEIEKWLAQPEASSPFEHETSLFNSNRAVC